MTLCVEAPQVSDVKEPRLFARFVPQEEDGGYTYDLRNSALLFDVTEQLRDATLSYLRNFKDDSYRGDELWKSHPASTTVTWEEPFKIEIEYAIADYIEARLDAAIAAEPEIETGIRALAAWCNGSIEDLLEIARKVIS